jgi:hypothetical protein
MLTINARNANQALPEIMYQLQSTDDAVQRSSRNGPVMQFVEPFAIKYRKPTERVVFWPERDANPFFHLLESLWMLAGRNDVAYVARYSSNIGQFSDDGKTFHGAYGARWRRWFRMEGGQQYIDQLLTIAAALKDNPEDRRQVLQMWDATSDLGLKGKDLPCNLMITFQRGHTGALNMCVYNRSNDIVWGALGANCVHMSYLQEYMAARIGCEVGWYEQISANMHGYVETTKACLPLSDLADLLPGSATTKYQRADPYQQERVQPFPLVSTPIDQWDSELTMFMSEPFAMGYRDPFFRRVAIPMVRAYDYFKNREDSTRFDKALAALGQMADCDWKVACVEWIQRRQGKAVAKAQAERVASAANQE